MSYIFRDPLQPTRFKVVAAAASARSSYMVKVRRLIETPVCKRYVQINIRDFMMSEKELADKYGVPWYPRWFGLGNLAAGLLFGVCVGRLFGKPV